MRCSSLKNSRIRTCSLKHFIPQLHHTFSLEMLKFRRNVTFLCSIFRWRTRWRTRKDGRNATGVNDVSAM